MAGCPHSVQNGLNSSRQKTGSTETISAPLGTYGILGTGYTARVDAYDTGFTLDPEMGLAPRHTSGHTDLLLYFQPLDRLCVL